MRRCAPERRSSTCLPSGKKLGRARRGWAMLGPWAGLKSWLDRLTAKRGAFGWSFGSINQGFLMGVHEDFLGKEKRQKDTIQDEKHSYFLQAYNMDLISKVLAV